MSGNASRSPGAREAARHLLARAMSAGAGRPEVVSDALQQTCRRVSENLRDAMGTDGSRALLERALARIEPDHPALKTICPPADGGIRLDGVAASVETHGTEAVTAAVEALLAALIDVLGRLIGEDMAIRLIDHNASPPPSGRGAEVP